jgi:hypothetical protein
VGFSLAALMFPTSREHSISNTLAVCEYAEDEAGASALPDETIRTDTFSSGMMHPATDRAAAAKYQIVQIVTTDRSQRSLSAVSASSCFSMGTVVVWPTQ